MPEFLIKKIKCFLFLALFISCQPQGVSLEGKVVRVADGDTITILMNNRQIRVRLFGIDCPERKQAFGTKAKEFTSRLVSGKTVTVISRGEDRYGRIWVK